MCVCVCVQIVYIVVVVLNKHGQIYFNRINDSYIDNHLFMNVGVSNHLTESRNKKTKQTI